MTKKKLYRSTEDRMIAGVIAGLADYFDIEVTWLRLFAVVGVLVTGFFPGVVLYLLAIIIIPVADGSVRVHDVSSVE